MGNTPEILQKYCQYIEVMKNNSECTIINSKSKITLFLKWLQKNNISIDNINQTVVNDYLHHCKQKYAKNSLMPISIDLKKFMEFLGKDIKIKYPRMCAPERDKRALTQAEVRAMFKVADDPLELAILQTLYTSGMRASELINLDISDVDFDRMQIVIRHGKGDIHRIVNITKECASCIQRWLLVRPKPVINDGNALFISPKKQRVSKCYIDSLVKRVAAKAMITKKVYPHKFRITMITHMAEAGLSAPEIASQSGHKDIATLLEYVQHNPQRIRDSYDKVFETGITEKLLLRDMQRVDSKVNEDHYKKAILQKYLDGEIDMRTMNSMLKTFEDKEKKVSDTVDRSYA